MKNLKKLLLENLELIDAAIELNKEKIQEYSIKLLMYPDSMLSEEALSKKAEVEKDLAGLIENIKKLEKAKKDLEDRIEGLWR